MWLVSGPNVSFHCYKYMRLVLHKDTFCVSSLSDRWDGSFILTPNKWSPACINFNQSLTSQWCPGLKNKNKTCQWEWTSQEWTISSPLHQLKNEKREGVCNIWSIKLGFLILINHICLCHQCLIFIQVWKETPRGSHLFCYLLNYLPLFIANSITLRKLELVPQFNCKTLILLHISVKSVKEIPV